MPAPSASSPRPAGSPPAVLTERVAILEALFRRIQRERMAGVPILHAELRVQAVGFAAEASGACALGVLITPWFMNLLRLPLQSDAPMAAPGLTVARAVGEHRLDFLGASEDDFGTYEACSLFSPMFEFQDQAAAVATAEAVLEELRRPPPVQAGRRALLFGRRAEATTGREAAA